MTMINNFKEIKCLNNKREVTVYVCEYGETTYYVEDGGQQINITYDEVDEESELVNISDIDVISSPDRIENIEDFQKFLSI